MHAVALSTMWGIKRFPHLDDFFAAGRAAGFTSFELNHGVNSAMLASVHLNDHPITSVHEPCPADLSPAELRRRDWLISATDEENRRRGVTAVRRSIDLAHQAGAYVVHHNDGACRPILPDMIELGIDILNPIQWRCKGMEREGLKADFGDKLIFHGAMDNQYTLPFGTVDEVRAEVLDNLRILGAGGGYILAPCHNIQAVSPAENIVTMYETCYALGWT